MSMKCIEAGQRLEVGGALIGPTSEVGETTGSASVAAFKADVITLRMGMGERTRGVLRLYAS